MDIKYNSQQELEMWFGLACKLQSIPNDYRSQNHTAISNELEARIHELIEKLDLDERDWIIENTGQNFSKSLSSI